MSTCGGCGGVLGRDCWNESDCMWIAQQEDAKHAAEQEFSNSTFDREISDLKQQYKDLESRIAALELGIK